MKRIIIICFVFLTLLSVGCRLYAQVSDTPSPSPTIHSTPFLSPTPTTSAVPSDAPAYIKHGFVNVGERIENIIIEARYYTSYNFIGKRIDGYNAPIVLLTKQAADALKTAADRFYEKGYIIKLFDGYRPKSAVEHFKRWAKDLDDQRMKQAFYPNTDKSKLFSLGYIASRSGHSRGSTVDLTIVDMRTGKEVDMGSPFDYLDVISHHDSDLITETQLNNRKLLKSIMEQCGFVSYSKEWWHYSLKDEPYPDTYFEFPVE